MKTSIHLFGSVVLLGAALAGCGLAQQPSDSAPAASTGARAEDLARYIRDEHRRHVRVSTGIYAHQCFTDDDLRKFRAARTAGNVAQTARRSPRFRAIVTAVAALSVELRRSLLSDAALMAHPTWEELGRITTDGSGQTLAGAAAEREISAALVDAAEEIIADADHSRRKQ
jgi:hypothetical protein